MSKKTNLQLWETMQNSVNLISAAYTSVSASKDGVV
ncbi:hypothetical protein BN3456_00144 [Clostridium sp. C105KSO13]|nr:hypothetical protein BN3456_00144 [Clostridium sp. C105KSO13]